MWFSFQWIMKAVTICYSSLYPQTKLDSVTLHGVNKCITNECMGETREEFQVFHTSF